MATTQSTFHSPFLALVGGALALAFAAGCSVAGEEGEQRLDTHQSALLQSDGAGSITPDGGLTTDERVDAEMEAAWVNFSTSIAAASVTASASAGTTSSTATCLRCLYVRR